MISLGHFLSLGGLLFAMSVIGIFLNRKNLIVLLMAIELMLLAVNMNFVAFSYYLGDMAGQIFVFFILTVAAAESAIGLAMATEQSQAAMHENGLRPSGMYSVEGTLSKEQHERLTQWLKSEAGAANTGKPLVLDRAAKWLSACG